MIVVENLSGATRFSSFGHATAIAILRIFPQFVAFNNGKLRFIAIRCYKMRINTTRSVETLKTTKKSDKQHSFDNLARGLAPRH